MSPHKIQQVSFRFFTVLKGVSFMVKRARNGVKMRF